MNEPKSSRYHRLRRRAGVVRAVVTVLLLLGAAWLRPALPPWAFALALAIVVEACGLPIAFYRGIVLERRYELSRERGRTWLKDEAKGFAIVTLVGMAAAEFIYALIRFDPRLWWLAAAAAAAACLAIMTRLAPVVLLPLFYRIAPLERPALESRLRALCGRAGVAVLGIYQWDLGSRTRRANALLTGMGSTRRILLSDTLLAEYSDDEIEVILGHELAHHVHRDITMGLLLEFALILAAFGCSGAVLHLSWQPLGLTGPADGAGLPALVLVLGGVMLAAAPLVNYVSRRNERRADQFALELTGQQPAFVSAMRRLAANNLAEENPSKMTVWLFHTHPPVEDRIATAERGVQKLTPARDPLV